jgi:hypothetical protein
MIKDDDQEFVDQLVEEFLPIYMNRLLQYLVEQGALNKDQLLSIQKNLEIRLAAGRPVSA